ncbi:uncharacterized protein LOC112501803 [Cynara cardunculus var. scolymus]|uniref:uncharacterized protein LOC112501803 n=1 Tax=Cynara cardunculus var. scolymus TaxID=59895 RepID=UPI000D623370|nr:uncharacterized protein LOC112501803 [Cynara cardunculus var. scolymus]
MAGMLPGVETARRRRLRGWCDSSSVIGSSFGSMRSRLSHDTHLTHDSFLERNQSDEDDNLGGAAREAKERLNGRLRGHLKSEIRRQKSQESVGGYGGRSNTTTMVMENLQMDVFGLKKSGSKRFSLGRIGLIWKLSNQDCMQFA